MQLLQTYNEVSDDAQFESLVKEIAAKGVNLDRLSAEAASNK